MISITDKSKCTGCTACVTVCPRQCIVMRRDREGFDYPVANPDLCIGCGRCDDVCPVLNLRGKSEPLSAYAVRVPEYLDRSSSGGVFPKLAEEVIKAEGVVFGAVMNDDLTVGHSEAETMDQVQRMRGSRYVQSDMYSAYEDVKHYLEEGRKVLFTGTPCQIAGLNAYLGKEYADLLTAETACHGVPGPGLWARYADALGKRYGTPIGKVCFRDKRSGWRRYSFTFNAGDRTVSVPYVKDPYMSLFVQDMILRPSCHSCPAREGRSGSDLTLADLWNVAETVKEMDDDKGVSLVLANTARGVAALDGMDLRKVDAVKAMRLNSGFATSVPCPERREEFFDGLHIAKDLISYMKGFVVKTWSVRKLYRRLHTLMSKVRRRISR